MASADEPSVVARLRQFCEAHNLSTTGIVAVTIQRTSPASMPACLEISTTSACSPTTLRVRLVPDVLGAARCLQHRREACESFER